MLKRRRLAAFLLTLLFLFTAIPARAAVFSPDIRVLLSIGKKRSFAFTPVGSFTLKEDPSITVGNDELEVNVVGGRISIEVGGKTVTAPSLTFLSGTYGGKTDYVRLKNAEHGTCTYLGNLTFDVSGGYVRCVNTLPLEQYLYGVVPHEMSNLFPVDALKAQAICARNYAVTACSKYNSRAYDIVDTSKDQVYRGYASANRRAIAAVDTTRGEVLTYEGDIIETYYSASNGGQTERTGNVWSTDFPYYVNADDPFDLKNPSSLEEKSFIPDVYTEETMALMDSHVLLALENAAYATAGSEVSLLETVAVTPKTPNYEAPSRSFTEVEIALLVGYVEDGQEKEGQVTVTFVLEELNYGSFENALGRIGAKKTSLRLRGAERGVFRCEGKAYSGWFILERRYGHGVGLSQRGAQERARAGQPYTEILSFYYVNTLLSTVGSFDTAPKITSSSYKVRASGISGVKEGTSQETLLQGLSSSGSLSVVSAKGSTLKGDLYTGAYVRNTYNDGTTFFDLPVVLYGDLDGDGKIGGESDAVALQGHLLRENLLTGARLSAADVNHDGSVNTADLILLIRYANGDAKISQGG